MTRRRQRKMHPNPQGFLLRLTRRTPSEERRVANSLSLRIGADLVEWIRSAAADLNVTQGELARSLILAGREKLEIGELQIENGRKAREIERKLHSDALGRSG